MPRAWRSSHDRRHSSGHIAEPRENAHGVFGIFCGFGLWVLSAVALGSAMHANLSASLPQEAHGFDHPEGLILHLRGAAVLWTLTFTTLQLMSLLVFAFVLRACYRLRTAFCFTIGTGLVMLGDCLGLLGLLIWLGTTLGVG